MPKKRIAEFHALERSPIAKKLWFFIHLRNLEVSWLYFRPSTPLKGLALATSCPATFWKLLLFGATFWQLCHFEQLLIWGTNWLNFKELNAPINVKPAVGGRASGGDLNVFVFPGVGHLTDLVLPGEGVFESFFAGRGDIWLPTKTKKTETEHMFPASTLHAGAVRFEKIRKSWRPMRTSEGWVDFTVLSSNFVCFSVFLINWTS